MPDEPINVRGPCSSCGAPLASDQRYCVECGQRVGPPLALPYALPAPLTEPPGAASRWALALPMPLQMATTFAAIALGFGVVIGTAISPNLAGIVAAPPPTVVAQAPPETPSTPSGGGGGAGPAPAPAAAPASTVLSASSGGGGGAGGGGGKHGKKKKKKKAAAQSFSGTVVRTNPVAQSYTISTGGLIAIHADSLPQVGDKVEVNVRRLANGTYAETGARNNVGTADSATFSGIVTYCADLENPSAACDGSSATDHFVYSVSGLGASVLVSAPHPALGAPPKVGSSIDLTVHIGDPFQQVTPASWQSDPSCTPPYNEQNGLPSQPVKEPELTQTSVNVNSQSQSATLEAVLQTVCPGGSPKLVLSADDVREAGRDLSELAVPNGIDISRLNPGQAVLAALDVAPDGTLTVRGVTSDQGAGGADDPSQGQGTLTGS